MDYLLGSIMQFPYNFVPMGWLLCNGQILSIQQNSALFSLIGNKFGGDGTTNFALPNLQGAEPNSGLHFYICTMGVYPTRD